MYRKGAGWIALIALAALCISKAWAGSACADKLPERFCRSAKRYCYLDRNRGRDRETNYVRLYCAKTCGVCKNDHGSPGGVEILPPLEEDPENAFDVFKGERLSTDTGWSLWTYWSTCSVTCGMGQRSRSRVCQSEPCEGASSQRANCQLTRRCIVTKEWTKRCVDERDDCRKDFCSTRKKFDCKSTCAMCFKWTDYGIMDKCDLYNGICSRRAWRHCVIGKCLGLPYKSRKCAAQYCQNGENNDIVYGAWGKCSADCGPGKKQKICTTEYCIKHGIKPITSACNLKDCPECEDRVPYCSSYHPYYCTYNDFMRVNCKKWCKLGEGCGKQGWSEWSKWSRCSELCGVGKRIRTRTCTGSCEGFSSDTEKCDEGKCPVWSDWSDWSDCTSICGVTPEQERTRKCIEGDCKGNTIEKRSCKPSGPCTQIPNWSEWGAWSACTKSCLGGRKKRERTCNVPSKCGDKVQTQTVKCNDRPCYDRFTQCNLACGGGYRWMYKSTCSNSDVYKCPGAFEGCNYQTCTKAKCQQNPNLDHRYGSTTCCDKTKVEMDCGRVLVRENEASAKIAREGDLHERVINGIVSDENAWPWMAMFMAAISRRLTCAGTLIHKEYVLTAAHCVKDTMTNTFRPKSDMAIFLGVNHLLDISRETGRKVRSYVTHPDFKFPKYDIALLKIDPVEFTKSIYPACMPKGEDVGTNQRCYGTGWGVYDMSNPRETSPSLREVALRVMDSKLCMHAWPSTGQAGEYVKNNFHRVICAGSVYDTSDTCAGDSGGPLICQRCSSCSWYVAGVTSFGPAECGTAGRPGVYSKVMHFESWIHKHVPDLKWSGKGKTCNSFFSVRREGDLGVQSQWWRAPQQNIALSLIMSGNNNRVPQTPPDSATTSGISRMFNWGRR